MLDNAGSVEQVRPLLPGTPACAVIVTSRDSLAGLVARDGATRLELDLLPPAEAVGLLRALIGRRVEADPGAAAALASAVLPGCRWRCGSPPSSRRPALICRWPAGRRAGRPAPRLDLLAAGGDPADAVRAVFSWSYRHLDAGAARVFRLAGLHPGADFEPYAAVALAGTGLRQARAVLDMLTRAHLIQPPGRAGTACMTCCALTPANSPPRDGEEEQWAALTRLFDHYLHTAGAAMDALYPAERHRRPTHPRRQRPPSRRSPDADAARAWLDAERTVLVAVTVYTAGHGWPAYATSLAATLFRYLETSAHAPRRSPSTPRPARSPRHR